MSLDSTNMVKFAALAVQELAYPQSVLAPLVVDICGYHAVGATGRSWNALVKLYNG